VREHDLGWVRLPGRVPREELRERYAASDVYLSPARLESFGIAALEARTVGLPVIGRTGSGVGEFVHHAVNGLVVSSDSEMAAAIANLATDPARVAAMRAWNVSHPPEQAWSQVAGLAVSEYERAISLVRT
jgi:glycosyltransferase involved in cell wall biosynthesis